MKIPSKTHRLAAAASAHFAALGLLACLAVTPQAAWSQTAAPKPAAAPAAGAKAAAATTPAAAGTTKGTGSGPILTRDELRVCLAQEDNIRKRIESGDAERTRLNQEKADIATAQQAMAAERAPLEELKKQADEFGGRLKAFAAKVEAWNKRVATMNDEKTEKPNVKQSEQQRAELARDREELTKESAVLEAEKARMNATSQEAVGKYNAKAVQLDARVRDWNERNAKHNEVVAALEAERLTWVSGCSQRRYREEDEIAIRAGK